MAKSCLHCIIRDAIDDHAGKARKPLSDGTVVVLAPEALAALAAVAADIIAAHPEGQGKVTALTCLLSSLTQALSARGLEAGMSVSAREPAASAEVLH